MQAHATVALIAGGPKAHACRLEHMQPILLKIWQLTWLPCRMVTASALFNPETLIQKHDP